MGDSLYGSTPNLVYKWWRRLLPWGFIQVTSEGIINAVFIFLRFVLIISFSTLLTLTTAPLQLTDAIEAVMKPLAVVKFPVHEVALMLSIALRFVPTLMDEAQKIMNAQRARGVDFGGRKSLRTNEGDYPNLNSAVC